MKHIQKLVIAAALVVAVAISAFAADKQAHKERVIRIQSNGQVVAELHLLKPCHFICGTDQAVLNVKGGLGTYSAKGRTLEGVLQFDDGRVDTHINGNIELTGSLEDLGLNPK